MKKFREFIKPSFEYDSAKMGNPVLIQQGQHSLPKGQKPYDPAKQGNPVLIQQGKHSLPDTKVNEAWNSMVAPFSDKWADHKPMYHDNNRNDPDDWRDASNPTKHPVQIGMHRYQQAVAQSLPSYEEMLQSKYHDGPGEVNTHWGQGPYAVHTALHEHYKKDIPHFSSIFEYTNHSSDLNRHLFEKHMAGVDPGDGQFGSHHIGKLDKALNHSSLPMPLTVFSGLGFNPREQANEKGRLFLPAYTSTSIQAHTAAGFGSSFERDSDKGHKFHDDAKPTVRHLLKLELPKGAPGHYVGEHSRFDNEREFLLPRRQVIQLHSTQPDIHDYSAGTSHRPVVSQYHVWHGRVMHPDEYK